MAEQERASPRDRDATARRILGAALDVLVENGASGLGVNAVARRAGCDKQLIYRYFGGLDGLAEALGVELAGRWTAAFEGVGEAGPFASYAGLIEAMALRLIAVLRDDAALRATVLWELAGGGPAVGRIADAKSLILSAWMRAARGGLAPPPGVDAPAVNALIVGGLSYAALSAAATGRSTGVALLTDADWGRLEAAVRALVRAAFAPPPPD